MLCFFLPYRTLGFCTNCLIVRGFVPLIVLEPWGWLEYSFWLSKVAPLASVFCCLLCSSLRVIASYDLSVAWPV